MSINLLRVKEVANLLGISKCLLYQFVRLGKIQTVRINSTIRFREEDVINFIESNLDHKQSNTDQNTNFFN